jgi:Flp pilus assembly protein TadD
VWWGEADLRFERVLAGQPFSPAARQGRATVLERLGDAPLAREAYDKAWALNPGDAAAAAGSLRQALAGGDWDGALERLGRALGPEGVDPKALRAAALDGRGWIDRQAAFDAAAVMVQAATGERAQAMARLDALRAADPEAPLNGQLSAWLDGLGQAP